MYKKRINDIPPEIIGKIYQILNALGLHPVHKAYSSIFKGDNDNITIIVIDEHIADAGTPLEAYGVVDYSCRENRLYRWSNEMPYPDALIEMGNRIKE